MTERKKTFIKRLEVFLATSNGLQTIDLHHLEWEESSGTEWVLVFVNPRNFKRVDVTGDSNEAIMRDLLKMLALWNSYEYERR